MMSRRSRNSTNLLICGYIRSMDKVLRVPDDVATVVDLFHGSYNGVLLTTRDLNTININIQESKKEFVIGPGYRWKLETDPLWRTGSLDFFLKLVSSDENDEELVIFRRLSCLELKSSYSCISTYRAGTNRGWPFKCLSYDEIRDFGALSTKKQLTFMVEIQILKIIDKTDEYKGPFNYHAYELIKSGYYDSYLQEDVVWEYPMYFQPKLMAQQNIKWKIDGDLMKRMKNGIFYPFKQFESNVFNDMWLLRVAPNGENGEFMGDFDIYLQLCSFPKGISELDVLFTTQIGEMRLVTQQKKKFSIKKNAYCWTDQSQMLSFDIFKLYHCITIFVNIQILDMK